MELGLGLDRAVSVLFLLFPFVCIARNSVIWIGWGCFSVFLFFCLFLELDSVAGLDWAGLGWAGLWLGWNVLGLGTGLGESGLGCHELGWAGPRAGAGAVTGLGWTEPVFQIVVLLMLFLLFPV